MKYANISREDKAKDLKQAIDLLVKARLLLPVFHSNCSGIPIRAGINPKIFKLYFLDIGLLSYLSGLEWSQISALDERALLNEGILAEQFIAQHLAYRFDLNPPSFQALNYRTKQKDLVRSVAYKMVMLLSASDAYQIKSGLEYGPLHIKESSHAVLVESPEFTDE